MEYILLGFFILLLIILMVLLLRTKRFVPQAKEVQLKDREKLDEPRIIESLQTLIRFKTVSYKDTTLEDKKEYEGLTNYLLERYPTINKHAKVKRINRTGILFELSGLKDAKHIVFMSHYDVVPENGDWKVPPFSGELMDGKIYGRGTLDTKSTLVSVMEAVEHLLKQDKLNFNLYLAFSGDEETRGPSADAIVQYLNKKNIKPDFVLDEGGAIVSDVFPKVSKQAAMVGLAEKGFINVELKATSLGGHASMPKKSTPITVLAKAVVDLNQGTLFKLKKTKPTELMLNTIAPYSESFMIRLIFANLWLFWPLVKYMAKKSDGELLSLLHTTQAFTQMQGSDAMNVLPSKATIGINYRVLTHETVDDVIQRIKRKVNTDIISVKVLQAAEPTSISKVEGSYTVLEETIREHWENVVPTPYLMMAGTDSRYYHAISEHVYRFSPMSMTKKERETIHSTNEAIRVEELIACTQFYVALLKKFNV